MTRAQRLAQVEALSAKGLTYRQIAERLGIARSTVGNLFWDPDGSKQLTRRERYRGTCKSCGAKTDGSGGYAGTPDYCNHCGPATPEHRAKITYWTKPRIIAAIQWWASVYGEPPACPDWSPTICRTVLHDALRAQRGQRLIDRREVPHTTVVFRHFDSWNAAIAAAGFEPRAADGSGGNILRRRDLRAKAAA